MSATPSGPEREQPVDELEQARFARGRDDALARHFAQRAAMEDVDRAVRRALELGLAADVRQLVDDALDDGSPSA